MKWRPERLNAWACALLAELITLALCCAFVAVCVVVAKWTT